MPRENNGKHSFVEFHLLFGMPQIRSHKTVDMYLLEIKTIISSTWKRLEKRAVSINSTISTFFCIFEGGRYISNQLTIIFLSFK
jgi:hypothetical protein